SLGGRYVTASDVGTYVADMDVIAETTRFATGRSEAKGGAGDSSVLTAYGVFQGMRAAAEQVWGEPSLRGHRVGIAGVGKVGHRLADLLASDGATLAVTDVDAAACARVAERHPGTEVLPDTQALTGLDLDVYAPCAMGGALDDATVGRLRAPVVCGAANNQLVREGVGGSADLLRQRGILYAPDFVVNSGGVIQVADELHGFDFARAYARTTRIYDTTRKVLTLAADRSVTPAEAARQLAEERMAAASPGGFWLPGRAAGR
ncbi:MAG: Glu/Leu/Phe/Val dehydrogenase family protein, partial [Lapillicoccus sp.]